MPQIITTTNYQDFRQLLESDRPLNVTIVPEVANGSKPAVLRKTLDRLIDITINLNIDLTDAVAITIIVKWLWDHIKNIRCIYPDFYINGNELPPNDSEAIKLVEEEIKKEK